MNLFKAIPLRVTLQLAKHYRLRRLIQFSVNALSVYALVGAGLLVLFFRPAAGAGPYGEMLGAGLLVLALIWLVVLLRWIGAVLKSRLAPAFFIDGSDHRIVRIYGELDGKSRDDAIALAASYQPGLTLYGEGNTKPIFGCSAVLIPAELARSIASDAQPFVDAAVAQHKTGSKLSWYKPRPHAAEAERQYRRDELAWREPFVKRSGLTFTLLGGLYVYFSLSANQMVLRLPPSVRPWFNNGTDLAALRTTLAPESAFWLELLAVAGLLTFFGFARVKWNLMGIDGFFIDDSEPGIIRVYGELEGPKLQQAIYSVGRKYRRHLPIVVSASRFGCSLVFLPHDSPHLEGLANL